MIQYCNYFFNTRILQSIDNKIQFILFCVDEVMQPIIQKVESSISKPVLNFCN